MNETELATLMATVKNIQKELGELKQMVKKEYLTKEGSKNLGTVVKQNCKDIKEIQGNLSKAVWIVLSAVMTAVIYLVIRNGGG